MKARVPLLIFISFFCVYFVTSSGGFESGDALTRYETAKSFVGGEKGELHLPEDNTGIARNEAGKLYSCFGTLQALILVPIVAGTKAFHFSTQKTDSINRLVFNLLVIPSISALTLTLLFLALSELGFSVQVAALTAGVLGIATPFWAYARCAQEENLVALGFTLWLLGMARFEKNKSIGLSLAAVGGCVAIGARWAAAAPLFPLLAISGWRTLQKRDLVKPRELISAMAIAGSTLGLLLWYNSYRFGNPLETGYGILFRSLGRPLMPFDDIFPKILTLLFSPYRGLFLYSPVLIFCFVELFQRRAPIRWERAVGILGMSAALLLNSGYAEWTAGYSWGPRFLIAPLVLFAPLMAAFLSEHRPLPKWAKGILVVSIFWQFLSVLLPSSSEEIFRMQNFVGPNTISGSWKVKWTPVYLRFPWAIRAIRNTVEGNPGVVLKEGTDNEAIALQSSDFQTVFWWPFRFAFRFNVFSPLFAAVLSALIFSCGVFLFREGLRDAKT